MTLKSCSPSPEKCGSNLLSHPPSGSTIGASGLNFSVPVWVEVDPRSCSRRNIFPERSVTVMIDPHDSSPLRGQSRLQYVFSACAPCVRRPLQAARPAAGRYEAFGLLVRVGFGIAAFTPPAYPRGGLPRPSMKSHLGDGFALRCFQRLS